MGRCNPLLDVQPNFLTLLVDILPPVERVVVIFPLVPWNRRDASPLVDEVIDGCRNRFLKASQFFKTGFDAVVEDGCRGRSY